MGTESTISASTFPDQGAWLGRRVRVCFNYDSSATVGGVVVRDDAEEPGRMIIRLDDDRFVLSTECMYQTEKEEPTMALEPEPMTETLARADATVRFTATAGEQNGPYAVEAYRVERGPWQMTATGLNVADQTITAAFPATLAEGDVVRFPGN